MPKRPFQPVDVRRPNAKALAELVKLASELTEDDLRELARDPEAMDEIEHLRDLLEGNKRRLEFELAKRGGG